MRRNQTKPILVDPFDLPILSQYSWFAHRQSSGHVYILAWNGQKQVRLHRVIMQAPPGEVVDHINGDTYDNRRANLRLCTARDNARNAALSKKNKSGYKGVFWDPARQRWIASIKVSGKSKRLGRFTDPILAAKAYDRAARESFGEFAKCNFPTDPYPSKTSGYLP